MTLYRLVAGSEFSELRWYVQRSVNILGFHLFWLSVTKHYSRQEAEFAFKELTNPGAYKERL